MCVGSATPAMAVVTNTGSTVRMYFSVLRVRVNSSCVLASWLSASIVSYLLLTLQPKVRNCRVMRALTQLVLLAAP